MSANGKLLILDFDGTMTDAELEGAPFRDGYLGDVAILTGQPMEEILTLAERFEAEIAENPDAHGWVYAGQIVAPATVDPYLRIMPVARLIFDEFGGFPDDDERNRLLDGILYKYNYHKTRTAFREGARQTLEALTGTNTHVVTNSHTEPVQDKIRTLSGEDGALDWLVERVYGRAKKYVVDAAFTKVPESLTIDGLGRPVLLRRRQYYDVLDRLVADSRLTWSDVVVVGDIFELDLALPLALGARVGLVVNDFTPAYETAFVSGHPRGQLVRSLSQIPAMLQG